MNLLNNAVYSVVAIVTIVSIVLAVLVSVYRLDDRRKLIRALKRSGLRKPVIAHISRHDWRVGSGEAIDEDGVRVRFRTSPRFDSKVRLEISTAFSGRYLEETTLAA